MKIKTVYVCEVCGYESEDPAEIERCERDAEVHELPPIGAKVRLVSDIAAARHLERVYTVVDHG
ncbi:MAG: hypothetical protein EBS65_09970, partial [Betaproteobacteria bacterium]|nr:hypothetical protein [Betaproteobacteria bacterium]